MAIRYASTPKEKEKSNEIDDRFTEKEEGQEETDALNEYNDMILKKEAEIRREISAVSTAISTTSAGAYFGRRIPSSTSLIDRLQNGLMPQTGLEAIEFAFNWYEKDDALGDLIDLKVEFASSGFALVSETLMSTYLEKLKAKNAPIQTVDENNQPIQQEEFSDEDIEDVIKQALFNEKLKNIVTEFGLSSVAETLFRDYFISDSMILYWKTPGGKGSQGEVEANINLSQFDSDVPGLIDISAISPKDVQWDNSLGKDELQVKIPIELVERIRIALDQDEKRMTNIMIEGLLSEGVPVKYIEAVKADEEYVLLSKEDGDNWAIYTKERKHHGLAKPSMVKIFIPLATRMMLTEGDFAAGVMTKHFIFHIRSGESITSGINAGSTKNWAAESDNIYLRNLFMNVNKTTIVATNHTVNFSFIFPPIEMFSAEKYISSLQRILNWAGISLVLYSGEGAKYSGGFINIKRVMSTINFAREKVVLLFRKMLSSEFMISSLDIPDGMYVVARFNNLGLKEEAQILDELKVLLEKNATGPDTVNRELGRSPQESRFDRIVAKLEDVRSRIWNGTFGGQNNLKVNDNENSNGPGGSREGAGRPPNKGTITGEGTRTQDPAPKT